MHRRVAVVGEDEQDQRLVVAQRHAPDHAAGLAVGDVDILVARPVAARFERGDDIAEPLLETILRPEGEAAHRRMQAVGADDEIEPPLAAGFQSNGDMVLPLVQRDDLVAEDRLRAVLERLEQQPRQRAAADGHVAAAGEFDEDLGAEAGDAFAGRIDDAHLANAVTVAQDFGHQTHALGDVVAEAPEIDDIAAAAQRRRMVEQGRREAGAFQPIRKRRPGDPGAGDQHGLSAHEIPNR